ncbi:MAG: hypothetical protein Q8Q09_13730 [Deltaproteobacteria bacterium]|nr:hypothetical protein [Deltaproteobacteria bacterium]
MATVPTYAVVPEHAVSSAEDALCSGGSLESRVEAAFARMDRKQPALATYLTSQFEGIRDETAEALGSFLSVMVHESFDRAFGDRVCVLDASAITRAQQSIELDETLRRENAVEALETDDIVAMQQPAVMGFLREQLDSVLASEEDDASDPIDVDALHAVYRAMMVAIVSLSATIRPVQSTSGSRLLS